MADARYKASGDTVTIRSGIGEPRVIASFGVGANLTRYRFVPADENIPYDFRGGMGLATLISPGKPVLSFAKLRGEQVLTGQVDNANNNEDQAIMMAVGYGMEKNPFTNDFPSPPPGMFKEMKWFTAVGATTLSATITTKDAVSLTWTGIKPATKYAILGLMGWSAGAFHYELVLNEQQTWRPGWFAGVSSHTAPVIYLKPGFRPTFNGSSPPNMNMSSTSADTAEYLTVLLGEIGEAQQAPISRGVA
jgi:hypothetical protein